MFKFEVCAVNSLQRSPARNIIEGTLHSGLPLLIVKGKVLFPFLLFSKFVHQKKSYCYYITTWLNSREVKVQEVKYGHEFSVKKVNQRNQHLFLWPMFLCIPAPASTVVNFCDNTLKKFLWCNTTVKPRR